MQRDEDIDLESIETFFPGVDLRKTRARRSGRHAPSRDFLRRSKENAIAPEDYQINSNTASASYSSTSTTILETQRCDTSRSGAEDVSLQGKTIALDVAATEARPFVNTPTYGLVRKGSLRHVTNPPSKQSHISETPQWMLEIARKREIRKAATLEVNAKNNQSLPDIGSTNKVNSVVTEEKTKRSLVRRQTINTPLSCSVRDGFEHNKEYAHQRLLHNKIDLGQWNKQSDVTSFIQPVESILENKEEAFWKDILRALENIAGDILTLQNRVEQLKSNITVHMKERKEPP